MNCHSNKETDINLDNQIDYNDELIKLLKKYHIDKNKYIISSLPDFYEPDNLIAQSTYFDLICPICLNILINPINCSINKNSHSFCKKCIDIHLQKTNICPICKNIFEYKINKDIEKLLNSLFFKCNFNKKGCNKIINYSEYFNHLNNCEYNNNIYECQVEKYNKSKKLFEKCFFKGNIKSLENHFLLCAFTEYKCLFCSKKILLINLKEHSENICKVRIINSQFGNKYIGEKKNNKKEGLGILYYSNGTRYEGEWKNDKKEGYGIFYYSSGDKYEGEFRNDKKDGIGIY